MKLLDKYVNSYSILKKEIDIKIIETKILYEDDKLKITYDIIVRTSLDMKIKDIINSKNSLTYFFENSILKRNIVFEKEQNKYLDIIEKEIKNENLSFNSVKKNFWEFIAKIGKIIKNGKFTVDYKEKENIIICRFEVDFNDNDSAKVRGILELRIIFKNDLDLREIFEILRKDSKYDKIYQILMYYLTLIIIYLFSDEKQKDKIFKKILKLKKLKEIEKKEIEKKEIEKEEIEKEEKEKVNWGLDFISYLLKSEAFI